MVPSPDDFPRNPRAVHLTATGGVDPSTMTSRRTGPARRWSAWAAHLHRAPRTKQPRVDVTYEPGERVRYVAAPMFDLIIETGDVGVVTHVSNGWVFAVWPRAELCGVPLQHVRPAPGDVALSGHSVGTVHARP
jgi:hypothetical protein